MIHVVYPLRTHAIYINWINGNTLFVDIGNKNLSQPLTQQDIASFDIATPPNWQNYIDEYEEDLRLMTMGIEAFVYAWEERKRRIQFVLKKIAFFML